MLDEICQRTDICHKWTQNRTLKNYQKRNCPPSKAWCPPPSYLNHSRIFSGKGPPLYLSPASSTSRTLAKWEESIVVGELQNSLKGIGRGGSKQSYTLDINSSLSPLVQLWFKLLPDIMDSSISSLSMSSFATSSFSFRQSFSSPAKRSPSVGWLMIVTEVTPAAECMNSMEKTEKPNKGLLMLMENLSTSTSTIGMMQEYDPRLFHKLELFLCSDQRYNFLSGLGGIELNMEMREKYPVMTEILEELADENGRLALPLRYQIKNNKSHLLSDDLLNVESVQFRTFYL